MKSFNEIIDYIVVAGKSKTEKGVKALLMQGILSGLYIAIGAIGYFNLVAYTSDPGLGKFLGSLIFPTGIIAVLLLGTELYTSNCMAILSVYKKEVKLGIFMKMLFTVLGANLIGTIIMGILTIGAGIFSETALDVVSASVIAKTTMPIGQMFISSILCNIIVCSGVMMAYSAKAAIGKIMAVWFPISVFVLSGTEHIVANMYYFTVGFLNGTNITMSGFVTSVVVVTIGNFIGGAMVVAGSKYYIDQDLNGK